MGKIREVHVSKIVETVRDLSIKSCRCLPGDVRLAMERACQNEESPVGKSVLGRIINNYKIAESEGIPVCQDTGVAVVYVTLGQDCHIVGGGLLDAINEGVRKGYEEGFLRKSVVKDPLFDRKNTGDNTPAVIHGEVLPGDEIKICVVPKGGGAENMSALKMLSPSAGIDGVKGFVVDTVGSAGANPCPPLIIGVGIGSDFEGVAALAKKAVLRPVGTLNPDPGYAKLEKELLEAVNNSGIGPQGLGGRNTALAVHIEAFPCHIASIPVAVNIQCHAARCAEAVI